MAHEDPQPGGDQTGWIQCISPVAVSPSGSGWLRHFVALKWGVQVLRVWGSLTPVPSRLVSGGQRDSWGQVQSGWKRGSLSLAGLPLGPQTASRGTELSLLTKPPPAGTRCPPLFSLGRLTPLSASLSPLSVLSESPRLRPSVLGRASGAQTPHGANESEAQGRWGGLGPAHIAN